MPDLNPDEIMTLHRQRFAPNGFQYCDACMGDMPIDSFPWPCLPFKLAQALVGEREGHALTQLMLTQTEARLDVALDGFSASLDEENEQRQRAKRAESELMRVEAIIRAGGGPVYEQPW